MDWQTLAWETLDGPIAAPLRAEAGLVDAIRRAADDAASAALGVPVAVVDARLAAAPPIGDLDADLKSVASIAPIGAERRQVTVALESSVSATIAGAPVDPAVLTRAMLAGVDAALAGLVGEGLGMDDRAVAAPDLEAPTVALRLELRGPDGTTIALIVIVAADVPAEIAAHVTALGALGTADAPAPSIDASAPADAPAPATIAAAPAAAAPAPAIDAAAPAADALTPATDRGEALGAVAGPGPATGAAAPATAAIRPADFEQLVPRAPANASASMELLLGVNLQVTVEMGRTRLPIREILALAPGSIVELDKLAGEPVDILVNGRQIATGEIVVVDDSFGVRVIEIASRQRQLDAGEATAA
jgi:flagellar motor switch protein FliN/FliY